MTFIESEGVRVYHGDCIEVMRSLPENSVDAIVTDPPYLIDFMGKGWDSADGIAGKPEVWREALRVLKPGGHLLAFGGTRTWHRLAVAIEDAGFEVRDSMAWMYGSGFPKSLDVSKAIDKRGGAVAGFVEFRDAVKVAMKENGVSRAQLQQALGNFMLSHYLTAGSQPAIPNWRDYQIIRDCVGLGYRYDELFIPEAEREVVGSKTSGIANKDEGQRYTIGASKSVQVDITAPATPAAEQWQGWGTALKPAHEPIVVARKPLIGTVAENVLTHGTGALNIDGCRIGTEVITSSGQTGMNKRRYNHGARPADYGKGHAQPTEHAGRWPANVILDESQAAELDKQSGWSKSPPTDSVITVKANDSIGTFKMGDRQTANGHGDSGGASRFFYVAKANKRERPNVEGVAHPTVKPLALMRYLVRLVTPPGGTVLEPFAGSGTTVEACILEGFDCIAIEMTDDYLPLIAERVRRSTDDKEGRLL